MRIVKLTRPAPSRPFGTGIWFADLPSNAAIDPNSAAVVAELGSQVKASGTNLNSTTFTAEITIVPHDQPLVPVVNLAASGSGAQTDWCKLGLPIPAGWMPTPDKLSTGRPGDCSAIFYQPDYVSPYAANGQSLKGRLYELWRMLDPNTSGLGQWSCGWAHRMVGVNGSDAVWSAWWTTGPGGSYKTDPDSTYMDGYWTTGSGISLAPTLLTPADIDRGYADHVLGLLVVYSSYPQVSPASKTDADSSTSLLREGQRFRFPDGYQIPSGLHPIAQVIARTATKHGLCIVDQAGCVAIRATPSVSTGGYRAGTQEYLIFNGFPWHDLELLTPAP